MKKPDPQVLMDLAWQLGAGGAVVIDPADIVVKEEFAKLCREPRCPGYAASARCPPHVGGPDEFRALQKQFSRALAFKIEVASDILLSEQRREVFRLLHEIAATLELEAVKLGFPGARGFAGGSCKLTFCHDKPSCRVLAGEGECRNPDSARQSLSGFGVQASSLMEAAGWNMGWVGDKDRPQGEKMAPLCGLVLLD